MRICIKIKDEEDKENFFVLLKTSEGFQNTKIEIFAWLSRWSASSHMDFLI